MSDVTLERLARRIRQLRQERGQTIQQVADQAGFSKGLLSKIETGLVSPPIATLAKVASALDVPIGEFFAPQDDAEEIVFFPRDKRQNVRGRRSSHAYKYEVLAPGRKRRDMQPMVISVDGRTYKFKLMDHAGEQFLYLLEGEMDYVVGTQTFTVHPQDCLYFDARLLHGPKLKRNQRATYLVVFSVR
jgi:transcriptional regulator with XRE-family HTH domain